MQFNEPRRTGGAVRRAWQVVPRTAAEPSSPRSREFPFGQRVLVTEDNWLIANEWRAALEAAGYEVVGIAVSTNEVIEFCRRDRPDFVLMDIRLLGDRDGIEAASVIWRAHDTRCVFITAQDDADTRARAAAVDPLGWIVKPLAPARLAATLVLLGEALH
jgi:AmiR/NasT family two-component response regulator